MPGYVHGPVKMSGGVESASAAHINSDMKGKTNTVGSMNDP
jgi:hypothetical protein